MMELVSVYVIDEMNQFRFEVCILKQFIKIRKAAYF